MEIHKSKVNHSEIVERRSWVTCPEKEVWNIPAQSQECLVQCFALTGHNSSTITLCTPMNVMPSPSPCGMQLILIRKLFYLCCTQELSCESNKLEGWCGLGHGFETSLWERKRKENLLFVIIYNTIGNLHSRDFCLKNTFPVVQNYLLAFHQVRGRE